jgi:carboxynorspermidine decarboxylase
MMIKTDSVTFRGVDTPIYIIEEKKLRDNLSLIKYVAEKAEVEIILAFKAFATWKTFPIFREYIKTTTASSLNECRLAFEEFGARAHTFSPAYTDQEIEQISKSSSHLSFNSWSQYHRFHLQAKVANPALSLGIRINPEYSEIDTELYNPCAPGSRFGVTVGKMPEELPLDIDGFHCHCHCESGADQLQRTLEHIEAKFGKWLPQLKWLNLGGGHLMTRKDYDTDLLISLMQGLHARYPQLHIILEPGSAFAWQTGPLVSQVVDIVEDHGIRTAILNVSFTCHMPDCLEMPYQPDVRGAESLPAEMVKTVKADDPVYRLGGNSCLSGDYMGAWRFPKKLEIGELVIFEDMIHYTMVKTNMFNGIGHPSIGLLHSNGDLEIYRRFGYDDYRNRMD